MPALRENPYWASCRELTEGEGVVFDWDRKRTYTRKHLVEVKIKEMGPIDVALVGSAFHGTVPLPGSLYTAPVQIGNIQVPMEYDHQAIMIRQSARRRSTDAAEWPWWIVTSEYGTEIPSRRDDPSKDPQNPELDLADISWDFEENQEAGFHDLFGSTYLNTAFEPLLKPPLFDNNYPLLTISRNELTYNFAKACFFTKALNDDTFLGVPRGCVQCLHPKSTQKNRGILRYWRTTYRMRVRGIQLNSFNTTPATKDLYRLPPLLVILPMTTGDGTGLTYRDPTHPTTNESYYTNKLGNTGANSSTQTGIRFSPSGDDSVGMCRGDPVLDSLGNPRYLSCRTFDNAGRPNSPPYPIRLWDSWQPLIQMDGLNRLGSDDDPNYGGPLPKDDKKKIGKPVPIKENNQQVHSPRLLNDIGQVSLAYEGVKPEDLTVAQRRTPPRAWHKQFVNFRYTNLKKLLVKGLT